MDKKIICVGIIGMFLLASIPTALSGIGLKTTAKNESSGILSINDEYGVELSCDEPIKDVEPGNSVTFYVTISNVGTLEDTYEVSMLYVDRIPLTVNGQTAYYGNPYLITLSGGSSDILEVTADVNFYGEGKQYTLIRAVSTSDHYVFDTMSLTINIVNSPNEPPGPPRVEYDKLRNNLIVWWCTDPEGDRIRYGINYGNNNLDECTVDEWTDFYDSGEEVTISCDSNPTGYCRILGEDEYGSRGLWSPTVVSKEKQQRTVILPYLLDQFPLLQQLLLKL